MCLYVSRREPFIATRDIWVYKVLKKTNQGLETPYQGTRVKVGEPIKASNPTGIAKKSAYKYYIESEGVHAYIKAPGDKESWSAVIPKGTKFWVQDDLSQIASETLIVSDTRKEESELNFIIDLILKEAPEGVGEYISGKGVTFGKHPVTGETLGVCMKTYSSIWSEKIITGLKCYSIREEALKDLDGRGNTEILRKEGAEITKNIPDWAWIPSFGELEILIIENLLYVNASLLKNGGDVFWSYSWSSTKYSDDYSWSMYCEDGGDWCYYRNYTCYYRWIFGGITTPENLIKVTNNKIELTLD